MADPLDLDAYFARIQWGGSTALSYETLAGLLAAHTACIPFENFDVLLGRGVRLDLDGLQAKLVQARRGGYCFEHATLFAAVLEALGFAPVRHIARVIIFEPRTRAARGHMMLTVDVAGTKYVVDPGFGPFGCRVPLPLDGTSVPMERPTHRLTREGDDWVLHAARGGEAFPAWISKLEVDNPVDFEMGNHYVATHPASMFAQRILASAVTREGRVNLMNRDVTYLRTDGASSWELPDRVAMRALLAEHFGFDLPEAETMRVPSVPEWA